MIPNRAARASKRSDDSRTSRGRRNDALDIMMSRQLA